MKTKELRELDAWIDLNVFGRQPAFTVMKHGHYYRPQAQGYTSDINQAWRTTKATAESEIVQGEQMKVVPIPPASHTTDPAAAMEVLKKCLSISVCNISPCRNSEGYMIEDMNFGICVKADTLELAICLFAEKLFKKERIAVNRTVR